MTTNVQRYPEKFEDTGGTLTTTFDLHRLEAGEEQSWDASISDVLNADYPFRHTGTAPGKKSVRKVSVNFEIVGSASATALDTAVDTMLGVLRRAGLGKLYTMGADGTRRWCWAAVLGRPGLPVANLNWIHQPVSILFDGFSDWFATSLSTFSTTVSTGESPKSVTWNNPGTARMRLKITATALGTNGYQGGFTVANTTLGQSITTTRTSTSTNSRVEIDSNKQSIRYSTDAGATYTDDYASATIPATQRDLAIELEPGDNTIVFTVANTPNVTFAAEGYAAYQ